MWERKLAVCFFLAALTLGVAMQCYADVHRTKEFYVQGKVTLEVCDGAMKFRKLRGRVYASMSQEIPACPRYRWITSCIFH